MNISYRPYRTEDSQILTGFILDLYREDISGKAMTEQKIRNTIAMLGKHPELGNIIVIESGNEVIGYAILINFWSNEYGGIMLNIDELYISPDYRGRGIATGFISHLKETRFNDAVAIQLEVSPENNTARRLYDTLGFKSHPNDVLTLEIRD